MSQNAASPPSRPPSSASSTASSGPPQSQLARVHHDHSRPLPPPRPELLGPPASPRPPAATSFRSASRPTAGLSSNTSLSGGSSAGGSPRPGAALPLAEVSLEVPRPDGERIANEYVEAPFRPAAKPGPDSAAGQLIKPSNHQRSACPKAAAAAAACKSGSALPGRGEAGSARSLRQHRRGPEPELPDPGARPLGRGPTAITKQPVSFTKEPGGPGSRLGGPATPAADAAGAAASSLSIMCDQCGRCRCESCREPPPLPSRWLCDNSCFCSAETALDYASCLCCVKGLFYHCADSGVGLGPGPGGSASLDSELGGNCADEPCSCTGSRKTARWTCLGALAVVLPCLLCYWPLRGCVAVCEACYAKHATQGCRCEPRSGGGAGAGLAQAHRQAGLARQQALDASSPADSPATRSQLSEALMRDSRDPEKRLLDPLAADL